MRVRTERIFLFSMIISLGIFGCSGNEPKIVATANQSASLVGQLPANPLHWKVITSTIDEADSTMATLYGNDIAVQYVRAHSTHDYPGGSVISLVTWTQQEDPRWFGARIPATVKSVEFVAVGTAADGGTSYSYTKYEGSPPKMSPGPVTGNERIAYLLSQRAAVMP
jgi:hypothetical protein